MAKQVTVNEIENLIKEKLKSSGAELSEDLISKIKENVLEKYKQEKIQNEADIAGDQPGDEAPLDVDISSEPTPTEQDTPNPESVQKEIQTDVKEQELEQKEQELAAKEEALNRKEEELKYKPQLPTPLKNIGKEEFFLFDENQISLGGEGLSNAQFYLKNNPEVKSSMHAEWMNKGMTKADLYKVEYKKIGEMEFDPFNGTTKLAQFTEPAQIPDSTPKGFPVETTVIPDEKNNTDDIFDEIIREKIDKYLASSKLK